VQTITEMLADERGVVAEPAANIAVHPAALVLQRRRQVPMIERRIGLDAAFEHAVEQAVVEVDAGLVDGAGALGDQPRPGKGEAIGIKAAIADQVEVLRPQFIVIAGVEAGIAIVDIAGRGREAVPDRGAAAIALAALDLVGGGRHAKGETRTEVLAVD
jgi:hypothetical protein